MGVYDRDWWKEKYNKKTGFDPAKKAPPSKPTRPSTRTTPSNNGWRSTPRKRDGIHPLMVLAMFLSISTFMFGLFTLIGDKKPTEKVQIIERIITPVKPAEKMPPRQVPTQQRPST